MSVQITFLLVIRNERERAVRCLTSMLQQTLDPPSYEIVVVDGLSQDGTRQAVEDVIAQHPDRDIRLLDNPGVILSCGWNIGIRASRAPYVVRPDAHAQVPPDFLEKNLAVMEQHPEAWAVGGVLTTCGDGFWGEIIAAAMSSRMGVGNSRFRVGGKAGSVDTVVFGLYKREHLLSAGGFDESIPLNQDNVCHARLRQNGGILYFDPSIRSTYFSRSSLSSLFRQMFRRGYWLVLMLKHQSSGAMQPRYVVPLLFVSSLLGLGLAAVRFPPAGLAAGAILGIYWGAAWAASLGMALSPLQKLCLPLAFLTTHVAYGIGSLCGLLVLPCHHPTSGELNRSTPGKGATP